ncbi:MAG: D-alanine--D-alanine ligase [Defluviitaleaceae bacterium]|nr:D-alanine--D-alanine ligase [Defluviitaleaceae bacterium]
MNQKNVLVLFGGTGPEHEISMASAEYVIGALGRHRVIPVYITKEGKWLLYDGKLDNIKNIDWEKFGTQAVLSPDRTHGGLMRIVGDKFKLIPVDVVFPVMHGPFGEDGTVQGLLELAGLPYVGCGVVASAVAMDKGVTKLVARALKIPQAEFICLDSSYIKENMGEALKKIRYKVGYPCFVKPACGGSSIGISKALNRKELTAALELAMEYSSRIVVEKMIEGREIEVGVFGAGEAARATAPGEIIPDGDFYDYNSKYITGSQTVPTADIPKETAEKLRGYALAIFRAIDGRGSSRVDFFVTPEGKIIFNEINTMPGFTGISMYAKMWKESGLSSQELIEELLKLALEEA